MINIPFDRQAVGDMYAIQAIVRPQSVFALVTLSDNGNEQHELRLDLGKAVFIDHVPGKQEPPDNDVRNLTEKIVLDLRYTHQKEYEASPKAVTVTVSERP